MKESGRENTFFYNFRFFKFSDPEACDFERFDFWSCCSVDRADYRLRISRLLWTFTLRPIVPFVETALVLDIPAKSQNLINCDGSYFWFVFHTSFSGIDECDEIFCAAVLNRRVFVSVTLMGPWPVSGYQSWLSAVPCWGSILFDDTLWNPTSYRVI